MNFINKYGVKLVFSDKPELNISASANDFGENMVSLNITRQPIERLTVGTGGTVASPNIFISVDVSIELNKTAPCDAIYQDRFNNNAVISGILEFTDDAGKVWKVQDLSISLDTFQSNATTAGRPYLIQGNIAVNTGLMAELGL